MAKKPYNKYYFDNPEIWDKGNRKRFGKESKFLEKVFKKHCKGKKVLDVGCGTGNHLDLLSKKGYTCVGVDLNKNIIRYAKKKYPNLKFEIKDMRKLGHSNKFDALFCRCTTMSYNLSNEDVVKTLKSFNKALKKGGVLVLETFNPIAFIEKVKFLKVLKENARFKDLGFRSVSEHRINENRQVMIEKRTMYKGNRKLKTDVTEFRLFFPQEMKYLLETNGFKFVGFYGGYSLGHKKLDGFRLITVAKKLK